MGMTQNFKQRGPQIVVILKSWKSQFDAYIPSTMSPQAAAYPSLFLVSSIAASRLFSSLLGPRSGGIPWGWGEYGRMACQSQWGISFFKAPESRVTKDDRSHNVAWLLHLVVFYPQSLHCRVQLPCWSCDTAACLQLTCDPPFSVLPLHLVAAPSCGCRDPCFSPPVSRRYGYYSRCFGSKPLWFPNHCQRMFL